MYFVLFNPFLPKKAESFKLWLAQVGRSDNSDIQSSYTESLFDSIRHVNEYGEEFWYARELQVALQYTEWRNFSKVIERAKTACENSKNMVSNHFVEVNKTIQMPKTAAKEISDYELSRYACYLIVQNGDSRREQKNIEEN